MKIFDAYALLRNGKDLPSELTSRLADDHQIISSVQWASLVGFLTSKQPTPSERSFLSWILDHLSFCRDLDQQNKAEGDATEPERLFLHRLNTNQELGDECIRWWISGIVHETLSTEYIAFVLAKITCLGMHPQDIRRCIRAMVDSGSVYDYRNLSELEFRKIIRRYPTGALSEKGALLLPALVASVATLFPVATSFLVARSLSFTGGTWDKLSSIPGFRFPLPGQESIRAMQECGVAMTVTHHDANPADRILYQLRSQTGTVESAPLIIASIVSKQLTFPVDELLLDVRHGPGAFFPDQPTASRVGQTMAQILREEGVSTSYVLTEASSPTGSAIGNALEVIEALCLLKNQGSGRWHPQGLDTQRTIALHLFSLLMHASFPHLSESYFYNLGEEALSTGRAFNSFLSILTCHGVPPSIIEEVVQDPWKVMIPNLDPVPLYPPRTGTLLSVDQKKLGILVNFSLSSRADGSLDRRAGIKLDAMVHETVHREKPFAWVFADSSQQSHHEELLSCFEIG